MVPRLSDALLCDDWLNELQPPREVEDDAPPAAEWLDSLAEPRDSLPRDAAACDSMAAEPRAPAVTDET